MIIEITSWHAYEWAVGWGTWHSAVIYMMIETTAECHVPHPTANSYVCRDVMSMIIWRRDLCDDMTTLSCALRLIHMCAMTEPFKHIYTHTHSNTYTHTHIHPRTQAPKGYIPPSSHSSDLLVLISNPGTCDYYIHVYIYVYIHIHIYRYTYIHVNMYLSLLVVGN